MTRGQRTRYVVASAVAAPILFWIYGSLIARLELTELSVRLLVPTVLLLGFVAGTAWLGTGRISIFDHRSLLRARARWRNHQCPHCGHPVPPKCFEGVCLECGKSIAPPTVVAPEILRQDRRRRVRIAWVVCLSAITAAIVHFALDLRAFRSESASQPTGYARARWFPFRSAGFVWDGADVHAHD